MKIKGVFVIFLSVLFAACGKGEMDVMEENTNDSIWSYEDTSSVNYDNTNLYQIYDMYKDKNHLISYVLSFEDFTKFGEIPANFRFKKCDDVFTTLYKNSSSSGKVDSDDNTGKCIEFDSGVARIGNIVIDNDFINYVGSVENLNAILENNGIQSTIHQSVIIEMQSHKQFDIPIIIWLETDIGDCFITIDESVSQPSFSTEKMVHYYKVYTYEQFMDKFALKDGTLYINDVLVEGAMVKFLNKNFYISFTDVMNSIGVTITWNKEKNEAKLYGDGKEVTIKAENYRYHFIMDSSIENTNLFNSSQYYYIIDGEIVMSKECISQFYEFFNVYPSNDYQNLKIELTKQL